MLAGLVLLSHSFELKDGNRNREIFTRLFHNSYTFGDLAVCGFFLLSGYLIVQSWQRNPALLDFLRKRVLRIYPGFIVALIVSVFVAGPLGASVSLPDYLRQVSIPKFIGQLVLLRVPTSPPVFQGQPYALVNNSVWTIQHEFRCYLLVAALGLLGGVKKREIWLGGAVVFVASLFLPSSATGALSFPGAKLILGDAGALLRFFAFFSVGGCFCLFREKIAYKKMYAALATPVLLLCLFQQSLASIALATVGAYLFFCFAFAKIPLLNPFKQFSDISYGVYLYGWPVQKLILWYLPYLSPWLVFLLSSLLSGICGLLSWHLVEQPFLRLKPRTASVNSASPQPVAPS